MRLILKFAVSAERKAGMKRLDGEFRVGDASWPGYRSYSIFEKPSFA